MPEKDDAARRAALNSVSYLNSQVEDLRDEVKAMREELREPRPTRIEGVDIGIGGWMGIFFRMIPAYFLATLIMVVFIFLAIVAGFMLVISIYKLGT